VPALWLLECCFGSVPPMGVEPLVWLTVNLGAFLSVPAA